MTTTRENISGVIKVLDEYMIRSGKEEINEMEANRELAKAGLLADEQAHPGRPLRKWLRKLPDSNILPQNIRQKCGAWTIRISSTIAKKPTIAGLFG